MQESFINRKLRRNSEKLKGCTPFKPQISSHSPQLKTPVYDRLTQQGLKNKAKNRINQEIKEKKEMIDCSFKPTILKKSKDLKGSKSHERLYDDACNL